MNNINLRAEVAVQITKEDLDVILFEALNAGGIAGWYELDKAKLTAGIKRYIEESCHIRIEDERLVLDDLTTNEADVIVQFALFGETKF